MAINHLNSSSDATSLYVTVTSGSWMAILKNIDVRLGGVYFHLTNRKQGIFNLAVAVTGSSDPRLKRSKLGVGGVGGEHRLQDVPNTQKRHNEQVVALFGGKIV
jgi:hypothetical protein